MQLICTDIYVLILKIHKKKTKSLDLNWLKGVNNRIFLKKDFKYFSVFHQKIPQKMYVGFKVKNESAFYYLY
jgi:hypothetical protein